MTAAKAKDQTIPDPARCRFGRLLGFGFSAPGSASAIVGPIYSLFGIYSRMFDTKTQQALVTEMKPVGFTLAAELYKRGADLIEFDRSEQNC